MCTKIEPLIAHGFWIETRLVIQQRLLLVNDNSKRKLWVKYQRTYPYNWCMQQSLLQILSILEEFGMEVH